MTKFTLYSLFAASTLLFSCSPSLEQKFENPPQEYKPMPFWHINGEMTTEGIWQQMKDASELSGFSGVSVLPLEPREGKSPGTLPKFLTEAYYDRFQDVLDAAEEFDMQVILYDDNDFPSGMAGGKLGELFPEHTMKRLDKIEKAVNGPSVFMDPIPEGTLLATVAMHEETLERIELSTFIHQGTLNWEVPDGTWKVMYFTMVKDSYHKAYPVVDYLDTSAVRHMINLTYEEYEKRFGSYFGNTIKMTFFDDVGFWRHPRTWTGLFNEKFMELNGYNPEPYYPALWYNIGPETESHRHAFYNTRAELLAEGYPKLVGEWTAKRGLKSTGHPPGNYDPTPIDMNGDIFKYYRYTAVPLVDAIIYYQFGQNGHKLISSAADYYDRPVVSTEIYGAFREQSFDSLMLYRAMMEMFARGVNFVIPHGMWYNPDPGTIHIPPLVSPYSEKIASALPDYSEFVGRSCLMLQGGSRVADIGVLYPFESLAGWYRFEDPDNPRQGFFVSPETDYQEVSRLLTNEIRRDFTFVHPEFFLEEKYLIDEGRVKLNNVENKQVYHTLILSGCNIISYKTLEKVRDFYKSGGMVISTTQLPFKSSELGKDQEVLHLVQEIFGMDALAQDTSMVFTQINEKGGRAVFIPSPNKSNLQEILDHKSKDLIFSQNPVLASDTGKFSYIHKMKDGRNIYYFANSSDQEIHTEVELRGNLKLEAWNPHTGELTKGIETRSINREGDDYTVFKLELNPVRSLFLVEKR